MGTSEDETFIRSMRLALAEGEMEDNKIDVMVSPRNTANDKTAISVDSTPGFEVFKLAREGKAGKKGEKKKTYPNSRRFMRSANFAGSSGAPPSRILA